jgi:Ca2+-binding EF-hand superfamily protein
MPSLTRLTRCALAAGLTLAALTWAGKAAAADKEPPDPPGTGPYMDQLRLQFAAWDLNSDGNLDKEELAKAFRGPDAKPYDYKKPSSDKSISTDTTKDPPKDSTSKDSSKDPAKTDKTDYSQYPDYLFLTMLDKDGDGQISRSEFLAWGRDYAVQLKTQADQEAKVLAMEAKLLTQKPNTNEYKKLVSELDHERAAFNKMKNEVKAEIHEFEKMMKQQQKKK